MWDRLGGKRKFIEQIMNRPNSDHDSVLSYAEVKQLAAGPEGQDRLTAALAAAAFPSSPSARLAAKPSEAAAPSDSGVPESAKPSEQEQGR